MRLLEKNKQIFRGVFPKSKKIIFSIICGFLILSIINTHLILSPSKATNSVKSVKILFSSYNESGWKSDIFVINTEDNIEIQLTQNSVRDFCPIWSPDGEKIAFSRQFQEGDFENYDIFVVNVDGSDEKKLTSNMKICWGPGWSPDGSKIVFLSNMEKVVEIYSMNSDGTEVIRLTFNSISERYVHWFKDGSKIAFYGTDDHGYEVLYIMECDGSGVTELADNIAPFSGIDLSPNGSKMLLIPQRFEGNEIFVINSDGSNKSQLTFNMKSCFFPSWSPDGSKIAFISDRDGDREVFIMNSDGSNITQLTFNQASDDTPNWSFDGRKIVFSSDRDGDNEIYVMNNDGTFQTQLTFNTRYDYGPKWQPIIMFNQPPVAIIDSIHPNPVYENQLISFVGYGTDEDGMIIDYLWRSDIDGYLSNSKSFNKSDLSVGTHTIYFKVKDDDGLWSSEVAQEITIEEGYVLSVNMTIPLEMPPSKSSEDSALSYNTILFNIILIPIAIIIPISIFAIIFYRMRSSKTKEIKSEKDSFKICSHCGFKNPQYVKNYCTNCGEALNVLYGLWEEIRRVLSNDI